MSWGDLGLWFTARLFPFLPRSLLKRIYPQPKLIRLVNILVTGPGPNFSIQSGLRLALNGMAFAISNALPFKIDLESIQIEVSIDCYRFGGFRDSEKRIIEPGLSTINLSWDISDNQAAMVKV